MRLLSLDVEGFRSFKERSHLKFPGRAGLFMVRGENLVEPWLSPNGSGKSSLWDAVCWCLYGKTARRLTAGEIESWSTTKTCEVTLEIGIGGYKRVVQRSRKPIRLLLDGQQVEQEKIDDLIGLTYEQFLQVVLMGQFGTLFPDMKPIERLALVSEVLNLELWTEASEKATKKVKALTEERDECERRQHGIEERIRTLNERLQQDEADKNSWAKGHREQLEDARERVRTVKDASSDDQRKLDEATSELKKARDTWEIDERDLGRLEKSRRELKEDLARIEGRLDGLQRERDRATKALDTLLDGGKVPVCSQCKQRLPSDRVKEIEEAARNVERTAIANHKEAVEKSDQLRADIVAKTKEIERVAADEKKSHADMEAAERTRNTLRATVERQKSAREQAVRDLERLESLKNPHEESLQRTGDSLKTATTEAQECTASLYDAQSQLDLVSFWPTGFKELRLSLVDQALDELTIHANSSLVELGLKEGWSLEFVVERETKSGTIARGFEVLVRSPISPKDGVRWENWSGGETQRLRIACAVGLANLVRNRMASAPKVEVWDEPTAHFNADGVPDLIEFFSARGNDGQVWLVDHRSLSAGAFDGVVTVVKDKEGSHIG